MIAPNKYFKYTKGKLFAEGVDVSSIANWSGTPTYVYSKAAFLDSYQQINRGLKGLDHLICYSVKSNSSLAVLHLLGEAGSGMDIVSGGELYRSLQAGVSANKIVFSGVGKSTEEMKSALKAGIYSFNVESVSELTALEGVARKMRKCAPVALRFNPDVNAKTHPYISTGLKENKFGMTKSEILNTVQSYGPSKWIKFLGISIHIGSQIVKISPLDQAYKQIKQLSAEVTPLLPYALEFLDLGGGFGIEMTKEKPLGASQITQLIKKHFKSEKNLKILVEPGRCISGNAGILLSSVVYKKKRGRKTFLVMDAGMNDFLRPALYQGQHQILPILKKKNRILKPMDVVGPICESADFLARNYKLSADINSGDVLAVLSAGAYGFVLSSQYNSRPRTAEILVDGPLFRVIRKREKLKTLILGEVI